MPTDDNDLRAHGPSTTNNSMDKQEPVTVSDVASVRHRLTRDNNNNNNVVVVLSCIWKASSPLLLPIFPTTPHPLTAHPPLPFLYCLCPLPLFFTVCPPPPSLFPPPLPPFIIFYHHPPPFPHCLSPSPLPLLPMPPPPLLYSLSPPPSLLYFLVIKIQCSSNLI